MAIPFLTPSRCVLLIGDEALYVYNVTYRAVRLLDTIPWQTENFEDTVSSLIRKECAGRSVLVLNDMTDQHFKGGQRLPRVGPMDRANVLQRKLQVAFPNYPIRGALPIKPAKGEEAKADKTNAAGLYLFAAVPSSEPVAKTMDAVRKSLATVSGFYLLPVEASDMVAKLAVSLAGRGKKPPRWVMFIGQHHSGALRQVITRDGQLAMTRMTPVTDTDADPEQWAQEVYQEFKATISYLSRFGFSADEGTDVIVVCSPAAGAALEKLVDIPCQYTTFTAPEAARELGITIGIQDEPRLADPLHAAWIGRKSRFILPMSAADLTKIHRPRKIAAAAMLLLGAVCGFLLWQVMGHIGQMSETKANLETQRQTLVTATSAYESEVARLSALGFDVKLVQGALGTYDGFDAVRMKSLPLVKMIDQGLGDELRLDALAIDIVTPPRAAEGEPVAQATVAAELKAALKLSFPHSIEPEIGVREVNNLKQRLSTLLPGYTVNIDKNVAGLEYSDTFSGTTGASAEEMSEQDYAAEISIQGRGQ